MRPETLSELIVVIAWGLLAIGASIAVKLDFFTQTTFFAVIASSSGFMGLLFGIRYYVRSKPFNYKIEKECWILIKKPIDNHKHLYVAIPQTLHKKGRNPRISYSTDSLYNYNKLLYSEIDFKGNIRIYHMPNSFSYPYEVRECNVRITA